MDTVIPARRWGYVIPLAAIMYILAYVDRIAFARARTACAEPFQAKATVSPTPGGLAGASKTGRPDSNSVCSMASLCDAWMTRSERPSTIRLRCQS